MNGNARRPTSNTVQAEALANQNGDPVEYVGFRVDGRAVVLNLSEHRRLSLERSLDYQEIAPHVQSTLGSARKHRGMTPIMENNRMLI